METCGPHEAICRVLVILDGESEDVLDVISLVEFSLAEFQEQFDVPVGTDPEMLDRYAVGPSDEDFVNDHLDSRIAFDFSRNAYFIEAVRDA